ncbi:transposase [Fervidobacterium thailandense]|uniref:Transposase IS4-like domain-containing protein n=1 Tax=Fervidobacterium thailandense TaxID=1008305 RepID=A0A1E3G461_9BACT|nr:transposase [Fervidobacterium thailandense]ODN30478.1 hypothetical protein A4H02_05475 [Fervidobacterium thailandense]
MNEGAQLITVSFNIPNDILESIASIVCKPSKRMYLRKYGNVLFLKLLIIFHFLQSRSIRELYRKIKAKQVIFDEKLPSIQTISYRMKKIDKEKLSGLVKKLIGSIVAIESTRLKKNEKLHLVIDIRREELIAFAISDQRDVRVAEKLIEGIRGKVIADRGYAEAEFVRKTEGYIRPRGKAGKEFTKRPLIGSIYMHRWKIEEFIQRLKMKINFERKKWEDVKVWIEWMLIGRMLVYLVNRIKQEPRTLEILLN